MNATERAQEALRMSAGMHALAAPPTNADDIPALIDKIGGQMEEFKSALKKHDEEIKAKGSADVIQKETIERLNAQITVDFEALRKAQDDQGKKLAALIAGGGGGAPGQVDLQAHARRFRSAITGKRVRRNADVDVTAYANYKDAFEELILNNANIDRLGADFRAALQIGSDPAGGWMVPNEISTEIEKRIHDTSPMRQHARVITIGRNAWEAPYKTSKGTSGGWVGERDSRPTTGTPTVGMQRIETHGQYAYPEITQDLLDDAGTDVEGMLVQDTEDEMSRQENAAFVTGNGVMKPKGFLFYKDTAVTTVDATRDWGVLQYVPMGDAGAFPTLSSGADDGSSLIDLIYSLHPNYMQGATFAMNRLSSAAVRKLRDADGRYLVGFGDMGDGVMGFNIHGYPVAHFEDMPNVTSDSFPIAFGNFGRGYYIIDRLGFRVLVNPYTNMPFVGFYITKRVGGDVRNFDAIKLMKAAAS